MGFLKRKPSLKQTALSEYILWGSVFVSIVWVLYRLLLNKGDLRPRPGSAGITQQGERGQGGTTRLTPTDTDPK